METPWNNSRIESNDREKKKLLWESARKNINDITDALGLGIDEEIKDFVSTLRVMDIPTTSSCSGHTNENGEGFGFPYVEIYSPRPKEWRENTEAQKLWIQSNRMEYDKLLQLLDQFYESRVVRPDVKIEMFPIGIFGGFRLRNSREDMASSQIPEDFETKIEEYKNEMTALGEFLKEKFLSS